MQVAFTSREEEEQQQQQPDEGELESDESEGKDKHISIRQSAVGKGVAPSEHH